MERHYREMPVLFSRGQVSAYEESLLPQQAVAVLENWVPEETEGLRVPEGWKKSSTTGGPATKKGLGATVFSKVTTTEARQRISGEFDWTANPVEFSITWPQQTIAGSTLLVFLFMAGSTNFQVDSENSINPGYSFGGYNILQQLNHTYETGTLRQLHEGYLLCKENASPETSSTIGKFNFSSINDAKIYWMGVELRDTVTGTGKNKLLNQQAVCLVGRGTSWANNGDAGQFGWVVQSPTNGGTVNFKNSVTDAWTNFQTLTNQSNYGAWQYSLSAGVAGEIWQKTGLDGIPVSPSTSYTFSYYTGTDTGTVNTARASIRWYNSSGTFISQSDGSNVTLSTALRVDFRPTVTATSPGTAAFATPVVQGDNNSAGADDFLFYGCQFEQAGSATAWEIGRKPNCLDILNIGSDSTNPISITDGGATTTGTFNYNMVSAWNVIVTPGVAGSYSGLTNGYSEDVDVAQNIESGGWFQNVMVGHKATQSSGQSVDTDVTISAADLVSWTLASIKFQFSTTEPQRIYVAAQNDATDFDLWYIDRASIDAGTWTSIESGITSDTDDVPVAFATGLGRLFFTHPNMTTGPKYWIGPGTTPVALPQVAYPGRAAAFHKSRFFTGGNNASGTRLFYSNIGDITGWPSNNFLEVGQDDGYSIEDIAAHENLLIIGKQNSIWSLSGSGADTFFLYQFTTGNAAPGRSVCSTPYGAMVAGTHDVWQLTGTSAETITKSLGAEYKPMGYVFTAYLDNKLFVLDQTNDKMFICNLENQAWWIEKHASTNNQLRFLFDDTGRLLGMPNNSTDTGLLMYKDLPSLTRTRDFSPLTRTALMESGRIWAAGPRSKMTPRWLFLQVRQRGSGTEDYTIQAVYDGTPGPVKTIQNRAAGGVYRERIDIGEDDIGRGISQIEFLITGPSTGNQYDIESAIYGFYEEEVR